MRFAALPVFMSLALLTAPAFAQSPAGTTARHNQPSGGAANSGQSEQQGVSMETQQKIRQSLEQNGFKNVQVIPQSFVIRAQAPDGSRVVMEISPDQFEEVVAPPANTRGNNSRSGSTLQDQNNSTGAGSAAGGSAAGSTTGTGTSR